MRFATLVFLACCLLFDSPAIAQDRQTVIRDTSARVVKIFGAGGIQKLHSYCSGFLVSKQGHVVTVWSHVLDTDSLSIVLDDGRRFEAKVLGAEPQLDLAVLKVDPGIDGLELNLPCFDLKQAIDVTVGTRVMGFSNMFKVAVGDEPVSVLHGVIAARTRLSARRGAFNFPYQGPVYVVDAITNNPGAGGGVLITRSGRLIGMIGKEVRNKHSNTWINYAVPVTEIREPIEQIISGNYETQRRETDEETPGNYKPVDLGLVMVPDVIFRTPAFVDSIIADSLADKAGLMPEDLVLFVNDKLVQSVKMLATEVGALEKGDTVTMIVRRGEELVTIQMKVDIEQRN